MIFQIPFPFGNKFLSDAISRVIKRQHSICMGKGFNGMGDDKCFPVPYTERKVIWTIINYEALTHCLDIDTHTESNHNVREENAMVYQSLPKQRLYRRGTRIRTGVITSHSL